MQPSRAREWVKRWAPLGLTLAVFVGLGCSGDASEPDPEPALEGEPLLRVVPGPYCGDPCLHFTLYLNEDGAAELRSHLRGEAFVGRSQGDLHPDTRAQLELLLAELAQEVESGAIESGIDPDCDLIPEVGYTLYVGDSSIRVEPLCPTPQLEPLTELVYAVFQDLYYCDASERLSPRIGCEPLDPYVQ